MPEYTRKPNTKCLICNIPVYKRPSQIDQNSGNVFCSQKCYGLSCRKETPCLVCRKPILAGLNKKTCSRGCANKHRAGIQYKLNSPRDKVKDLRRIKVRLFKDRGNRCEKCGYNKHSILHIHHKDANRKNNKLTNLILLCPNCHSEEHYLKK